MEYSKRILNYLEIIALSDLNHMMTMTNPVAIDVETLRIDSGYPLEKEVTELINMNP